MSADTADRMQPVLEAAATDDKTRELLCSAWSAGWHAGFKDHRDLDKTDNPFSSRSARQS